MTDEPTNCVLQLYINSDLKKLAKQSGLNLSKEFEEWIRIRLNQFKKEEPIIDIDLEVAKHHAEIIKLQSKKELKKNLSMQEDEEVMIIDDAIDNEIKVAKDKNNMDWYKLTKERTHGVQFLFQKKFNKTLMFLEVKDLILNRLKERGLIKEEVS